MPGVLLIEAMAQAGGVMLLSLDENKGKVAYLGGVNNAKMRRPVVPGDQLIIETSITKLRKNAGRAQSVIRVDGKVVAESELLFSIVDAPPHW